MRIGLIADTHIPYHATQLPEQLREIFRGVDMILHAGDIYFTSVLDDLERIAPVQAALGDDDPEQTFNDRRVKAVQVLNLEGHTIWLIHDMLTLPGADVHSEKSPDVIISGHTHHAALEKRDGIILINPGSATYPDYIHYMFGTVGMLNIDAGKVEAQIIRLSQEDQNIFY